jgi:nucleoside-triphosphatase
MNVLVTGNPGVGKTTLIQEVCSRLRAVAMSGFYTLEVREGARRVGFKIVTLDGCEALLAHVDLAGPHRVGRYGSICGRWKNSLCHASGRRQQPRT